MILRHSEQTEMAMALARPVNGTAGRNLLVTGSVFLAEQFRSASCENRLYSGRTIVTRRMASCVSTAAPAGTVASFVASLNVASSVAPNFFLHAMPAGRQLSLIQCARHAL